MKLSSYIELEIEISYEFYPCSKGSKDSYGVPLEPDEPASIEISSIECNNKEILDFLTLEQLSDIEELCLEDFKSQSDPNY